MVSSRGQASGSTIMKKTFTLKPENIGRLDIALAALLNLPRSQTQKLIAADLVFVNGKLPKKSGDRVKENDEVEVTSPTKEAVKKENKADQKKDKAATGLLKEIKVVALTPDYLVINKPAGLLVHPTMANEKDTLASWVAKKYPGVKKVGDDPKVRPGIVHRLDKEASGLIVVARTQKMFDHLKDQFKNRTVEKEYLALVHGRVAKDWDEITFPIARGETNDRMAARPLLVSKNVGSRKLDPRQVDPADKEKEAKTEFLIEQKFINSTLLRVILHTGRMHQIRVHMLAYNHPLVGDPLYFQKKRKDNLSAKLGRMFLHSTKLGFTDLNGGKQAFEAALPGALQKFLDVLK